MKIANNLAVSIHYTLKNDAGDVVDASEGAEPLVYLHGHQNIVPGLENALAGCEVGEAKKVSVSPAEGYGEKNDELIQTVPRAMFTGVDKIELGMEFQVQNSEGQAHFVEVVDVTGEEVVIDGNHGLAGQNLHFEVEVLEVREATKDELEHGHVHGAGCSH